MIWTFLSKGGWIPVLVLFVAGTGYGWYRTELARAKQQGIATQMAKDSYQAHLSFDSAVKKSSYDSAAAAVRIARLVKDSAANLLQRDLLSKAAFTSGQKADSVLALLMDSLPQLAGVKAAMDTLRLEVSVERDGRILAERARMEADLATSRAERLLEKAKSVIEDQAMAIDMLSQVGTGSRTNVFTVILGAIAITATVVAVVK